MGSEVVEEPTETTSLSSPRKIQTNDAPTANCHVSVTPTTLSIVQPHSLLPKPVPPRTTYTQNDVVVSSINDQNDCNCVTEFNLSGLKVFVTVENKNDASFARGRMRISFFSRSNCRECCAVRRFFRERALRFVEINVDVFAEREKDLRERTGSVTMPKIFFDERLIGGLVELNALRKDDGEELEMRLTTAVGKGLSASAYGFDTMAVLLP